MGAGNCCGYCFGNSIGVCARMEVLDTGEVIIVFVFSPCIEVVSLLIIGFVGPFFLLAVNTLTVLAAGVPLGVAEEDSDPIPFITGVAVDGNSVDIDDGKGAVFPRGGNSIS